MSICVICGSAKTLTEEHIFPSALGCPLALPMGTCSDCNLKSSNEFEKEFIRSLRPIRNLLQIRDSRRMIVPQLKLKAVTQGQDHSGVITPGGKMKIPPMRIRRKGADGHEEIIYEAFEESDAQELLSNLKKKGILVESMPAADLGRKFEAEMLVPFDFIGTECGLRTAAKSAYLALALKTGGGFVLSKHFDGVRNYIYNGGLKSPASLFLNPDVEDSLEIGPHQHFVACAGDAQNHLVHAIVVYFGALFYYVRLSDAYVGIDFSWTIACDAQKRQEAKVLVRELDNELRMLEDITTGNTRWNDVKASADKLIEKFSKVLGIEFEKNNRC